MVETKKMNSEYFRNLIFGAEDSLVSTVGVMFGVASAGVESATILLTGLVVIVVEALSMGAGAYLSESSENEFANKTSSANPAISGIIMFLSYFFAGFIPLAPYIFLETFQAKGFSIVLSLTALFFLGLLPKKSLKGGIRMVAIAGLAILFGYIVGTFFSSRAI